MTLQQFAGYIAEVTTHRELGLQALLIAAGGKILPEDARLWHRGEARRLEKLIANLRAHGCAEGNLAGTLVHQACKLPRLYPLPPWPNRWLCGQGEFSSAHLGRALALTPKRTGMSLDE